MHAAVKLSDASLDLLTLDALDRLNVVLENGCVVLDLREASPEVRELVDASRDVHLVCCQHGEALLHAVDHQIQLQFPGLDVVHHRHYLEQLLEILRQGVEVLARMERSLSLVDEVLQVLYLLLRRIEPIVDLH